MDGHRHLAYSQGPRVAIYSSSSRRAAALDRAEHSERTSKRARMKAIATSNAPASSGLHAAEVFPCEVRDAQGYLVRICSQRDGDAIVANGIGRRAGKFG